MLLGGTVKCFYRILNLTICYQTLPTDQVHMYRFHLCWIGLIYMPSVPRTVEVTNFWYNLLLLINIIAYIAEWPVIGEICDLLLAIQVLA